MPKVEIAEKEAFVPRIDTELKCPKCEEGHLQKIWARSKYFYGCSNYPDCDYSAPLEELSFDKSEYDPNFDWEQPCPTCGAEMKVRHGRFGAFLGCSRYPDCKGAVNIPKKGEHIPSADELPACPAKGCDGRLTARRSRFGKIFYSCSNFPECDIIVNKLDELENKYPDHPKTAYVRKTKSTKKGTSKAGTTKKGSSPKKKKEPAQTKRSSPIFQLSDELADLVGAKEMSRADLMRAIWDYIKANKLQNPDDKRIILPDARLSKVFGTSEPVPMFHVTKLLSPHMKR